MTREDAAADRLIAEYRATLDPFLFVSDGTSECPPGFHWGLAPAVPPMSELGPDGAEAKGIFMPPVPLKHRMWAGGEIETLAPIVRGMAVTRISTIADVSMRGGKAGPLCFVSVNHEIKSGGSLLIRERQDLVFRDSTSGARLPKVEARDKASVEWKVAASPARLFRFSAFTFNAHRIHYDLDYARDEEAYAGLLVHGPLQAALLLNQSSVALGCVPELFTYRCITPLIAGAEINVSTSLKGDGASGWIADANGVVTCEAKSSVHAQGTAAA